MRVLKADFEKATSKANDALLKNVAKSKSRFAKSNGNVAYKFVKQALHSKERSQGNYQLRSGFIASIRWDSRFNRLVGKWNVMDVLLSCDFVFLIFAYSSDITVDTRGGPFLRTLMHLIRCLRNGEITLRNDDQSLNLNLVDAPSISFNNLEIIEERKVESHDVTSVKSTHKDVLGVSISLFQNNHSTVLQSDCVYFISTLTPLMKAILYFFEEAKCIF
ncbi:hypothetical protein Tco_0158524 [Tanacetum coccineum]